MSEKFLIVPAVATAEMKQRGLEELERQGIEAPEMQTLWFAMSNGAPKPTFGTDEEIPHHYGDLAEYAERLQYDCKVANSVVNAQQAELTRLRTAAVETLRVARIANQGSRAYRRVFEDLEKAVEVK